MSHRLFRLTLILLALLLPFELERPWLHLGPLLLTNVEVILWLVLAVTAACWWQAGRPRPAVPPLWAGLGLLFVASLYLSGLLAPDFRLNAVKAATRTAFGIGLALAVSRGVRSPRDLRQITMALVIGGMVAAALGVAELLHGTAYAWLRPLRLTPTVVGPFLRFSSSFDYANQAAMFLEATLPLLVALCWAAWQHRRRHLVLLLLLGCLYSQAVVLTFSRAGFLTLLGVSLGLAVLLGLPVRFRGHKIPGRAHRSLSLLAAGLALFLLLLLGANSWLNPVFRMRMSSESDNDWYRVRFDVPERLELVGGQEEIVPVVVTNEGLLTWHTAGNQPTNLAARWVQSDGDRELANRPRWPLPAPLAPGETVALEIAIHAPLTAGEYRLIWDMVQEHVIWFGAKTGQETTSLITVSAAGSSAAQLPGGPAGTGIGRGDTFDERWSYQAPIPGRLTLWRAAAELWQQRPLLGQGLDNFRLLYGRPLGYEAWNTSIHSNNWYVETLVSAGLLGGLPFLLWQGLLLLDMGRYLRRPRVNVWQWALAAGLLAFLVHGLLDYFLLFYATGLLFWMLVGLWLSATRVLVWQEDAA